MWLFQVDASPNSKLISSLAESLGAAECCAELKMIEDPQPLSPKVLVRRTSWLDERKTFLMIEGTSSVMRPGPNGQDPLKPRFRAHRASDLAQLFRRFERFLLVPNHILGFLQDCKLPDDNRSTVFQNGISDWEFFGQVFLQYTRKFKTLLVAPNVADEKKVGRPWVLAWDTVEANQKAGFCSDPIRWSQSDGPIYAHFDSVSVHEFGYLCPSKSSPSLGLCVPERSFDRETGTLGGLERFQLSWRIEMD